MRKLGTVLVLVLTVSAAGAAACGDDDGGAPDAAATPDGPTPDAPESPVDAAGPDAVVLDASPPDAGPLGPRSLRFFGHGTGDIDRVKIAVDELPPDSTPGPPADLGATDFTIELWLRATAADNPAPAVTCGVGNTNWMYGHVLVDRDRYNQDRKFGLSIAGGKLVFGVTGPGNGDATVCGSKNVLDDAWHHVAVQRRLTGELELWVDGVLDGSAAGPIGNIAYPDDAVPMNFCDGPCNASDPFLVLGAEKHDRGAEFPSFSGHLDELRLSTTRRYTTAFTRPAVPFVPDAQTAALYHLDEGQGNFVGDYSGAAGGPSHGERKPGGAGTPGPEWSLDTPF